MEAASLPGQQALLPCIRKVLYGPLVLTGAVEMQT